MGSPWGFEPGDITVRDQDLAGRRGHPRSSLTWAGALERCDPGLARSRRSPGKVTYLACGHFDEIRRRSRRLSGAALALERGEQVVDRHERQRLDLRAAAGAERDRDLRDRQVVGRLDDVDEVVGAERGPLVQDPRRRAPRRRDSPRAGAPGFEFRVWTPFSVSVVSIRYSAMVPPRESVRVESTTSRRRARRAEPRGGPARVVPTRAARSTKRSAPPRKRIGPRTVSARKIATRERCCRPAGAAGSPSPACRART